MDGEGADMGKTLKEQKNEIVVTEVVRLGERLIIPEKMSAQDAVKLLQARMEYEDTTVEIVRTLNTFIWDGANALAEAMDQKYGWAQAIKIPGGFWEDDRMPTLMTIETGVGRTKQIPWGRFTLPGIDGHVTTDAVKKDGKFVFKVSALVRRKHENEMHELFRLMEEKLAEKSIYRGQAIAVRFKDDAGNIIKLPEPKFLDLSKVRRDQLILPKDVKTDIEVNVFTPIERMAECRKYKIPLKRSALFAGNYGVGKTLAAQIAGKIAVDNDVTYIYCQKADEFADVMEFAKQYQPAVVFCEDIDRVLSGARDHAMDHILNTIDGVDSKHCEIIVVLTSNSMKDINQAMLRPGRLDAVIWVAEPDAFAAVQLIRMYGGELVAKESDEALLEVGKQLAGQIPSVIREVVERAKLAQLFMTEPGDPVTNVGAAALKAALHTMKVQLDLLHEKQNEKPEASDMEVLGNVLGAYITNAVSCAFDDNTRTSELLRKGVERGGVRMQELAEMA